MDLASGYDFDKGGAIASGSLAWIF